MDELATIADLERRLANASKASNLTTLVAAVKAAGLVDTLNGPGPFTVFAPTNAAFEKLPAGTVDTLVKPENKAKLTTKPRPKASRRFSAVNSTPRATWVRPRRRPARSRTAPSPVGSPCRPTRI